MPVAGPAAEVGSTDRVGGATPGPLPATQVATRIVIWSTALFLALRAVLVIVVSTPAITPDELGAWAVAQYLVGDDIVISMRDMPRYSLLSGAAVAPVQALGLDPAVAYRVAVAWLSVFSLGAAWLARRTVQLLRPDDGVLAASAFGLVLLFPATLGTSSLTWAEPVVLAWWAVMCWGAVASAARRDPRAVMIASVAAGLGPVVHGRLIAAPAIWCAALLVNAALDRWRHPKGHRSGPGTVGIGWAAIGALTTAVVAVGTLAVDAAVAAAVWDDVGLVPTPPLSPTTLDWWGAVALSGVARVWYLLASTLALGALGAVALTQAAVARGRRPFRPAAITVGLLVVANLSVATLSAVPGVADLGLIGPFGGQRWDHVVYGRYIDGAVLVLAVVGLVASSSLGRNRATRIYLPALAVLVASGTVLQLRFAGWEFAPSIDVMIGGVSWMPNPGDGLAIVGWTAAAALATTVCLVALRRRHSAFVAVVGGWVLLSAVLGSLGQIDDRSARSHADLASQLPPPGDTPAVVLPVDVERSPLWRLGVFAQQRDLAARGWLVRFVDRQAGEVERGGLLDRSDVGAVVLPEDVAPPTGWHRVTEFDSTTLWSRRPTDG